MRFYLTALLFLVFDVEVIFLYPWAVELRKLNPALPVILMSGFCGANLKARAEAVGAKAVLFKPLKATQLAQCLAAVFARPVGVEQADAIDA